MRLCAKSYVQNFTSIATGDGNAAQKISKISTSKGDSFDRFRNFFMGFYAPTIVHQCFKFHVIHITAYGVIAENPRVGQLGQIFLCTL